MATTATTPLLQRATTAAATVVGAPAPPVELDPGTGHAEVRVLDSGELAVQQWIRGSRPLSGLDLAPPTFEATPEDVRVIGLHVVAGGDAGADAGQPDRADPAHLRSGAMGLPEVPDRRSPGAVGQPTAEPWPGRRR